MHVFQWLLKEPVVAIVTVIHAKHATSSSRLGGDCGLARSSLRLRGASRRRKQLVNIIVVIIVCGKNQPSQPLPSPPCHHNDTTGHKTIPQDPWRMGYGGHRQARADDAPAKKSEALAIFPPSFCGHKTRLRRRAAQQIRSVSI